MPGPRSTPRPADPATDLPPGLTVVAVLADSDRGQVLKVEREHEVFVLRTGNDPAGDFALEISLAGRLNDPAIVPPLEWGATPGGRPYLLRRFVEGRPFHEAAAAEPDQTEGWVRSLLDSLSVLHEAGLVHRDIKSDNVLVGEDGPVLVDLDLMSDTGCKTAAGSAFHIAPEVLLGHPASPSADLFSVGVMTALSLGGDCSDAFHDMFPSRTFWEASGLDASAVPGELGSLVRQLVRRNPSDRSGSAREAALRLAGSGDSPPSLLLPFLAGRDDALRRTVSELEGHPGERLVALLTVEDGEEVGPLLEAIELTLTIDGRRAARELIDDPLEDETLVREAARSGTASSGSDPMPQSLKLEDVERAAIQRALKATGGRKEPAARLLGISRAGLYAKIRRLDVGSDEDPD